MSFVVPNVRKLFKADPGHVLFDCDLSGADAQVVAWEANDAPLKKAFRDKEDIHNFNGRTVFGAAYDPKKINRKFTMRDEMKRVVHGTNYVAGINTLAKTVGWDLKDVRYFQDTWFRSHPGIHEWHRRTDREILLSRQVRNKFGYSICYFDRVDNILPKALAWIPQSTVAGVCARGMVQLSERIPWADILLQVHDSLVFQIPTNKAEPGGMAAIKEALRVIVPYPDPLEISWSVATSANSWGELKKTTWEEIT